MTADVSTLAAPIESTNISLDHFLPWSLVLHDLTG